MSGSMLAHIAGVSEWVLLVLVGMPMAIAAGLVWSAKRRALDQAQHSDEEASDHA